MARMALLFIPTLALLMTSVVAEAQSPPALDVRARQIIVFKDGYSMFVKQATGKVDQAGRAHIKGIPGSMVLGSFWIVPESGTLKHIVAKQQIIPKQGSQETEKSLELQFGPETAGRDMAATMLYFAPGIRWIPAYRIALGDKDKADMKMQAEILNEAEDLNDAEIDLVIGVPNFRFKDIVSPMSLEATLRNALRQAAPQLMSQSMSNVIMSQSLGDMRAQAGEAALPSTAGSTPSIPLELAGEQAHDLFVYRIGKFALRSGERAAVPVISASVPFRHLYTWEVRLTRSGTEAVPGDNQYTSPARLLKNEVWHQIELTNTTDVPWTTGAVIIMDDHLPIAQELLTYTSKGAKVQVPLTIAVDIRGTYAEEETNRELKAIRFDGHDYIRISKKGTLRIANHKEESAELIVKCDFGGNATRVSDEGRVSVGDFDPEDWKELRGGGVLNGHSTIHWDLVLKPKETKELTCEYFYYSR